MAQKETKLLFDYFCSICHRATNKNGSDYQCKTCLRTFHPDCSFHYKRNQLPQLVNLIHTLPINFKIDFDFDKCPICRYVEHEGNVFPKSKLNQLNDTIREISKEMIANNEFLEFTKIENEVYKSTIINPMDLLTVLKKATTSGLTEEEVLKKCYKSPAEVLVDFKLIVHNCIIFNGVNNQRFMQPCKKLFSTFYKKYVLIAYCFDCYIGNSLDPNYYRSGKFLIACERPHGIVWARKSDKGLYMPAKVIGFTAIDCENKAIKLNSKSQSHNLVSVCFFGNRRILKDIAIRDVFAFQLPPEPSLIVNPMPSNVCFEVEKYINSCQDVLDKRIENLRTAMDNFKIKKRQLDEIKSSIFIPIYDYDIVYYISENHFSIETTSIEESFNRSSRNKRGCTSSTF